MMASITAIQIFSKIRKNTVLIGPLTRDVEKEYHDVFLLPVGTLNYSRFNFLSASDTNSNPNS
jgi:hypothetical protein